jgi:hypothetical protein
MAINAAQVSATKKSRATQAASSTTRIAVAVRVIARVRESKGSTAFSKGRGSPPSWLGMNAEWRGIRGQILVAPTHSFRAVADPSRRLFRIHSKKRLMALPLRLLRDRGYVACLCLMTINCQPIFPPQDSDLFCAQLCNSGVTGRLRPAMARRGTRTRLRSWLASPVPQLTRIGLTIINVSRADPRLMLERSIRIAPWKRLLN